jgi:hypothetical protein
VAAAASAAEEEEEEEKEEKVEEDFHTEIANEDVQTTVTVSLVRGQIGIQDRHVYIHTCTNTHTHIHTYIETHSVQ